MSTIPPFKVARLSRSSRKFFRGLQSADQERVKEAILKICENPWRNHKRYAIRYLKGKLSGLLEYRFNTRPIFRIIYRVSDEEARLLEIDEKLRHLS